MGSALNPYQAWLDIPPAEQPPDYYRLLGVRRFEADAQVIARAAEGRIAHVREKAANSNQQIADWLIAQIAAARTCLTVPGSKAAYDQALSARETGAIAKHEKPRPAPTVASPTGDANTAAAGVSIWRWQLMLLAGAAAAVVVIGMALQTYSAGHGKQQGRNSAAGAASRATETDRSQAATPRPRPAGSDTDEERAKIASAHPKPEPLRARKMDAVEATAPDDAAPGDAAPAGTATSAAGQPEPGAPDTAGKIVSNSETAEAAPPTSPTPEQPTGVPPEATPPSSADANVSTSKAPAAPPWLRTNERGEPCEVTLADGTELKLDTYGDSYQGYQAQEPVDGVKKSEVVVDYQRDGPGSGIGAYFLQLDVESRKMYWIESGGGGLSRIRSADINGRSPRIVLNLPQQGAQALAIDPNRGKLYWANHAAGEHPAFGAPPDAARAVWQAGLDGSNPHPLFSGLTEPGAVAVEAQTGRVFYFTGRRLIRGEMDGSNEAPVIESLDGPYRGVTLLYKGFSAAIDPTNAKIYWCANQDYVARANLDGNGFEVVWRGLGHILGVAIDPTSEKLYLAAGPRMGVWRANTDGSQPQMVAAGLEQSSSIGIDSEHGYVYWTDHKSVGSDIYALIRRLRLPPPPTAATMPAPPLIDSIEPRRQRAGAKIAIRGDHFAGVDHVRIIFDDGQHSEAEFKVTNDQELAIVLPKRREGVRRAAIVVEGPGGVTVTLPRGLAVIKPDDRRITLFDRFQKEAFCFIVSAEQGFHRVEHSLVFVPTNADATAGGRGNTILFVKNGATGAAADAIGIVIYHEPFARILHRASGAGQCRYIPVPAIRPSFVESLLQYLE